MKKIGLALAFVVALLGVQSQVHADVADYEVHALIPATQIKGNHTEAFDMVLAPNQTQNMSFVITNHTDKDIVFDIAKGTAKTTVNGNVNYTADDTTFDTSMPEPIGEDMQIPATVTAKAATNTGFNVTLKTPKTAWRGLLAGGIKITPRGEVATKKRRVVTIKASRRFRKRLVSLSVTRTACLWRNRHLIQQRLSALKGNQHWAF